jgi:hypothetical protein
MTDGDDTPDTAVALIVGLVELGTLGRTIITWGAEERSNIDCGAEMVSEMVISTQATTATTCPRRLPRRFRSRFFNALDVRSCAGDQDHPVGGVSTSEDPNRIAWSRCLIVAYGSARRMAGVS